MSDHAYSLIAGIIFLLIALAHLLRIVLGTPVVTGFLSYEGFRFARKPKG
jgi:hypothetical protein